MNIFEQATRLKLRFPSVKGELNAEQLWDLPLQSRTLFDLDTVAKTVYHDLKGREEGSFVTTSTDPMKARLEVMLDIIKHVIQVKQDESSARVDAARKAEQRQRILEVMDKKADAALENETVEQLAARLKSLD